MSKMEKLEARRLLTTFQDIKFVLLDEAQYYNETTSISAPTLALAHTYRFEARAKETAVSSITSASLTVGDNSPLTMVFDSATENYELNREYLSLANLGTAFPTSSLFTVNYVGANDGAQQPSVQGVSTTASDFPAAAPVVTNFDALQSADPTQPVTITWSPFQGGTSADYIRLLIDGPGGGTVYATAGPGTTGAMTGTATQFTVPAGKLANNETYTAFLSFYHVIGTSNNGGITTDLALGDTTQFSIDTPGTSLLNGLLTINGTANNDTISLTTDGSGNYVCNLDALPAVDEPMSSVTSIILYGRAGNDSVSVDPSVTLAVSIKGAGGNDTLVGGSGSDCIQGGGGDDQLIGNTGADTIIGGVGNDSIIGGAGADELAGGADNDTIIGEGGADTIACGIGENVASGGGGNDSIYSINGTSDTLDGGAGTNVGQFDNIDSVTNIFAAP